MKIGIAYDVVRDEERQIVEAIRKRGHELVPFYVPSMVVKVNDSSQEKLDRLDFAFERCVSFYRALSSAALLEGKGIEVVNGYEVIRDCGDKLVTTIRLSSRGVPVPKTFVAFSRQKVIEAARELGYPVVVKPIFGSWGRMMARALSEDDLLDIVDFRESMPSPYFRVHYLQEFVNKPGRDIRSFYVWGEVPVAIYRYSTRWKTNTALGGKAEPAELSEELLDLTIKAAEAIGGGILGVDLLESSDGRVYVSEVNAVIEFRNTVRVSGIDLAGIMVDKTIEQIRR
ncbi:MAG: lysine biosynthesis protein LysX [Thaumarchaeota archaeon]|nr:lysine biosynthesis protein LysX [Candidatus Calditenuaceae archaeon]